MFDKSYTAFIGLHLIARGAIQEVVRDCKVRIDAGEKEPITIFDDTSGARLDIDFRGDMEQVLGRLKDHPLISKEETPSTGPRGPGRPKLGVVSREISLLPRHWDWLSRQRGGASATLRRLVDAARRRDQGAARVREIEAAAHRFMWDMAGDLPGFEEATRAFFRRDYDLFTKQIAPWPEGVATHLSRYVTALRESAE